VERGGKIGGDGVLAGGGTGRYRRKKRDRMGISDLENLGNRCETTIKGKGVGKRTQSGGKMNTRQKKLKKQLFSWLERCEKKENGIQSEKAAWDEGNLLKNIFNRF